MARKATSKAKKKVARKVTKKKAASGSFEITWRGIYLGFEGDTTRTSSGRTEEIRSARLAIEQAFSQQTLRAWANGRDRRARVARGEGHVESLCRLITEQLNAEVKSSAGLRFDVRPEESYLFSPSSEERETTHFKPNNTRCEWDQDRWIDIMIFPVRCRKVSSTGAAVSGPGGTFHAWKPDTVNPITVRFEYDCPYEPRRKPARKAARKSARKALR